MAYRSRSRSAGSRKSAARGARRTGGRVSRGYAARRGRTRRGGGGGSRGGSQVIKLVIQQPTAVSPAVNPLGTMAPAPAPRKAMF